MDRFIVKTNWPGYPIGVMIAFGGVRQEMIVSSMERHGCARDGCLKEWPDGAIRGDRGHCAVFPCNRVVLWFASAELIARTIAHECFHAAFGALPQLGIKLSDETEEVYAYAIDNLIALVQDSMESRAA